MNAPEKSKLDLSPLREIEGYLASAIIDSNSGMSLAADGGKSFLNIELAAAASTDVVRKQRDAVKMLDLNDKIEDILVSLRSQYHLMRVLDSNDALFVYLVLDRGMANLGMARNELRGFEKGMDRLIFSIIKAAGLHGIKDQSVDGRETQPG